jgi:hypothetical protein
MEHTGHPTVAYWYPEPFWADHEAGTVKNLLPFFDQVAILLPDYMHGRHREANPWLTGPLEEMGLLRVLEPGRFVDTAMTTRLHEILRGLLSAGVFDSLAPPESPYGYHAISRTRLGWNADVALASEFTDELISRQLARPSEDGVSIPLHPMVRSTVLVLLSQLAPAAAKNDGLDLFPVTPARERIRDLLSVLHLPGLASSGETVALDSEAVGLDLSAAPLDAVLAFRDEHGAQCRRYLRNVRDFVRNLSLMPSDEREAATIDRQEELADLATDLRKTSRSYWRLPVARVAVGGAGAVVSLATGSALPAALAAMSALLEWDSPGEATGPFSYLFEVQGSLGI